MKIVVYGREQPPCVMCEYTRKWLDRLDLVYEFIDITKDRAAENDARAIASQLHTTELPVVVVSNSRRAGKWAGFKIDKLKSLRETGEY